MAAHKSALVQDTRIQREQEFHDERFAHDVARASARKFYALDGGAKTQYLALIQANCSGKKSLEYGCGPGGNALALAQAGGLVTAIDISPVAIESAQADAHAAGLNVRYEVMNAEAMSFPDQSFDLICGSGILHHLDLTRAFNEIRRTLASNGQAVFLEPLAHNPFIRLYRKLTPRMRSRDEHPLRMRDIAVAKQYFGRVDLQFFNLFTLAGKAVPETLGRRRIIPVLHEMDQFLFKLAPPLRRYAWMILIRLSKPLDGCCRS